MKHLVELISIMHDAIITYVLQIGPVISRKIRVKQRSASLYTVGNLLEAVRKDTYNMVHRRVYSFSPFVKILEAIINPELVKDLTSHDPLSDKLYGFRFFNKSTCEKHVGFATHSVIFVIIRVKQCSILSYRLGNRL